MGNATATQMRLTAEEYYALPEPNDGAKQELVHGKVVEVPNPGVEHGEVQLLVGALLLAHVRPRGLGRVMTESGTVVDRGPDTVRGPDVSYYSKERMPLGQRVVKYNDQPPDLCVEVVSPSNTRRQLRDKVKEYFFAGVRAVWLIDPDERSVTVFRAPDDSLNRYDGQTLDGGEVLPGFACPVADLFA